MKIQSVGPVTVTFKLTKIVWGVEYNHDTNYNFKILYVFIEKSQNLQIVAQIEQGKKPILNNLSYHKVFTYSQVGIENKEKNTYLVKKKD